MKHRSLGLWLPVFFAATAPAAAHHSFAAEYDRDKPIMLTGTVTRLEWTNPHARLYIEVKDESGALVTWDFELGPPNGLMRQGWTRNSLRAGQTVTVNGFLSKDEPHVANARSVSATCRCSSALLVLGRGVAQAASTASERRARTAARR